MLRSWHRRWRRLSLRLRSQPISALLGVLAGLVVLGMLLGPVAVWLGGATVTQIKDPSARAAAVNATRQTLLAAVGGAVALTGLGFTARTFRLTRRANIAERYARAVGQLSATFSEQRLSAVYSLEYIMRESATDHQAVVDVLTAFVRRRAVAEKDDTMSMDMRVELQTVIDVLGARPQRRESARLSLAGIHLQDVRITGDRWAGADFRGANLIGADLSDLDLSGVCFADAVLRGASLVQSDLTGANLVGADLEDANATWATLERVLLCGANLDSARLCGANLRAASLAGTSFAGADLTDAETSGVDLGPSIISDGTNGRRRYERSSLDGAAGIPPSLVARDHHHRLL